MTKRRKFSDQFKAKVALEALRGDRTIQEIAAKHRLHPNQLSTWKKRAVDGLSGSGKGKDGQPKRDKQAGWYVKKDSRGNLKSTYGYSIHTGVDEDGFIQRQTVTAGNVHDSVERDTLLLGDETALYADAAYSSKETRDKLERFGIADQVQRKGYRNNPLSAEDSRRNDEIAVIRAGGERPFATYKSRYVLARTRFMGLAKNMTAYGIAAIAHNLRKGTKFLSAEPLRPAGPELCWISAAKTQKWGNKPRQIIHIQL